MPIARPTRADAGIFLISFAVLFVELLLTRIFSVTMFYHLSFLVVSLAMLGFGASGIVVNLLPGRSGEGSLCRHTALFALLLAVSTILAAGVSFGLPVSLDASSSTWTTVGVIYVLCVVPFLAGGAVVALLLTHHAELANRLYFFDLAGAAFACVAFIPATNLLGAPTAVLLGALVASAGAAVLAARSATFVRPAAIATGVLLVAGIAANLRYGFFDLRVEKGRERQPVLASKWNSFSRVEVIGTPDNLTTPVQPSSPGFSPKLDPDFRVPELLLRYDADAATQITGFDGDPSTLEHLGYEVTSAAYHTRRYRNVLVIGAGGGRDILTALHLGSGPVTGVEINPLTIDLMKTQFRDFTGQLYDRFPGVTIVNDEGRSFIRQSPGGYDLIQASLVDTWAASAAGAYALTENSLYTVEAFDEYFSKLTADGVISFSRWYLDPPVEPLRVVSLAAGALELRGVQDASGHVFVVRTLPAYEGAWSLCTILVKKSPFTPDEIERLESFAARMEFSVVYSPNAAARGAEMGDFHQLLGPDGERFVADYPFEIGPVTDDRPFFFDRVPLLAWFGHRLGLPAGPTGRSDLTLGGQTLLVALVATSACTALLFALPLATGLWRRRLAGAAADESTRWNRAAVWGVYFSCLGLGFIVVEIVLIQRFNLLLGYPVYSLSVVLFTMLLASGIGSLIAGRWKGAAVLPRAPGAICVTLLAYCVALPVALDALLEAPQWARILAAVASVAPVGLLMGMPFPSGVRCAAREATGLVPWAWAVNGGASVFGSTLTVLVSMSFGFTWSFLGGAAAYAAAFAAATFLMRTTNEPATQAEYSRERIAVAVRE